MPNFSINPIWPSTISLEPKGAFATGVVSIHPSEPAGQFVAHCQKSARVCRQGRTERLRGCVLGDDPRRLGLFGNYRLKRL